MVSSSALVQQADGRSLCRQPSVQTTGPSKVMWRCCKSAASVSYEFMQQACHIGSRSRRVICAHAASHEGAVDHSLRTSCIIRAADPSVA